MARLRPELSTGLDMSNLETNVILLEDAITAPDTVSGRAQIYVDTADGNLKVKFADGFVVTIATDQ